MKPTLGARAYAASLAKLALAVALVGCTGSIGPSRGGQDGPNQGPFVPGGGGSSGSAGVGGGSGAGPQGSPLIDPGRVGIHRLNNAEYNNTVRDLLGTSLRPAETFLAEEGLRFDNTATALGMTARQYDGYFAAANDLIVEAMANDAQRARFMTCAPAAAADPCARQIIETFGMQIYRRPLQVDEIDRAMRVYDADFARAQNGQEAIALAMRAMLSAANFLYRIEYDPNPASIEKHPVSSYEMASRLSYLHWSTMPDQALFDAAASDQLLDPVALESTVDRLLADTKSDAFVESFGGQWLSLRKLLRHTVTDRVFPTYSAELSDAMIIEGQLWFQEFLLQDRPLSEWFTADFNYVNDVLAEHYDMEPPGSGADFVKVENTTDQRSGFLGLSSFLTHTSVPSRTAPTFRGVWVMTNLLCTPPAPPPANIPALEDSADPDEPEMTGTENVRDRLAQHRTDPACSACHKSLDPIGFGLEHYDGIGRYRETYGNGEAIDSSGQLPDGAQFAGAEDLAELIAADLRFTKCVTDYLFTYALGREIDKKIDATTMTTLNERWAARGLTLRNLMKEIVVADAFRFRRGEAE